MEDWPDDAHYRALGTIQPMAATEEWSKTWDSRVTYHLGEAVAMIARSFTKGQTIRDLKKAHRMIGRAVEILEGDKS